MQPNWHNRLIAIPAVKSAGLISFVPIESGTSNDVFKLNTHEGIWIVRFNRASLGIDRHQELKILELIKPLKIFPQIISIDPDGGYLLTEYSEQQSWHIGDFNDFKKVADLASILDQIHQIPYQFLPSRLDHRIRLYLKKISHIPIEHSMILLETIQKLDFHQFWQQNNVLCHFDLNPGNIMGQHPTHLIDWEFAGQGHPLLDWLILEHETQTDLSSFYPKNINPSWLEPAQRMINIMMKLWPHQSP